MNAPNTDTASAYHRILNIVRQVKNDPRLLARIPPDHALHQPQHAPALPESSASSSYFVPPAQIKTDLLNLGLSPNAVDLLSPSISSLTETCRQAVARQLSLFEHPDLPSHQLVVKNLSNAFRRIYETDILPRLEQRLLAIAHDADASRFSEVASEKEPPFNAEFIPFLVQYFDFNAYPSLPDRELIAKKTGMSPRQIEVWFQNRRRRLRAAGTKLTRLDDFQHNANGDFVAQMPVYKAPEQQLASPPIDPLRHLSLTLPKYARQTNVRDVLEIPAAPHAFPRPISEWSQPQQRATFPPPEWRRQCNSKLQAKRAPSLDDLCQAFNRFHLLGGILKEEHAVSDAPPAATAAYTVVTERAPYKAKLPDGIRLPGIPMPRAPSLPPVIETTPAKSKKAGLPRRTPPRKTRDSRSPSSSLSLTTSSPSSSRNSSFTLSSPSTSPEPSTPPPIFAASLPDHSFFPEPQIQQTLEDDLFGDNNAFLSAPADPFAPETLAALFGPTNVAPPPPPPTTYFDAFAPTSLTMPPPTNVELSTSFGNLYEQPLPPLQDQLAWDHLLNDAASWDPNMLLQPPPPPTVDVTGFDFTSFQPQPQPAPVAETWDLNSLLQVPQVDDGDMQSLSNVITDEFLLSTSFQQPQFVDPTQLLLLPQASQPIPPQPQPMQELFPSLSSITDSFSSNVFDFLGRSTHIPFGLTATF